MNVFALQAYTKQAVLTDDNNLSRARLSTTLFKTTEKYSHPVAFQCSVEESCVTTTMSEGESVAKSYLHFSTSLKCQYCGRNNANRGC